MKSNQTTVIYIKPVSYKSAQGRDKRYVKTYDKFGNEKRSPLHHSSEFNTASKIKFFYDHKANEYRTGLDATIDNPYFDDVNTIVSLNSTFREIAEKVSKYPQLSLQTIFEIKYGLEPGTLHNKVTNGNMIFNSLFTTNSIMTHNCSEIEKFSLLLYKDRDNIFSSDTLRGALAIQLLKNHTNIAQDLHSINTSIHQFYIAQENETIMEKIAKDEIINNAIYEMVNLSKETHTSQYMIVSLLKDSYGNSLIKGDMNNDRVKLTLSDYIKANDKHQLKNIENFNKALHLYKNDKPRFYVEYLLHKAVESNIMSYTDGKLLWNTKRNIPELYSISFDRAKIVNAFIEAYDRYSPDSDETNIFKDLYQEVRKKDVPIFDI